MTYRRYPRPRDMRPRAQRPRNDACGDGCPARIGLGIEFSAQVDRTYFTPLDADFDVAHAYPDGSVYIHARKEIPMTYGDPIVVADRALSFPDGSWRRIFLHRPVGRLAIPPEEME